MSTENTAVVVNRTGMSGKRKAGAGVARILILFAVFINIYPILFVVLTSLKSTEEFYSNIWGLPMALDLTNYDAAWVQGHVGEYFLNSVIVTVVSLAFTVLFSALAGYALAKLDVPFTGFLTGLMFVSLIVPRESVILNLYQMMVQMKLVNTMYLAMIIVYVGWSMPMSVIIIKNFFQNLPSELLEASRIDGAGEMTTLARIVVPLMVPALGTVTIFDFCGIWGELMWAQISTSATDRGITLPVGLLTFQGQYGTSWGPMTAAICIIIVPLIIMFVFLQKYFIAGLTAGSVKG